VSPDAILAGLAGALAVAGAWEALTAIEQASVARALGRVLAPLAAARREGRAPTAPERRRLALVGAGALLGGGWLVAGPVAGGACAAGGPIAVRALLRARHGRWRAEVAAGAPSAARALSDALAGGHSIRAAVALAAEGGVPGAAGRELTGAADTLVLGAPTDAVLESLRRRAGCPAWDTIVAAILLQRDAGGDLAALLRSIAGGLEEAARVEGDARSATAQARFTAWLVALLPVGAALIAELARPGFAGSLLQAPPARWLLGAAAVCQAAACVLIRRIARVGDAA
jgi:tight adherence protein B